MIDDIDSYPKHSLSLSTKLDFGNGNALRPPDLESANSEAEKLKRDIDSTFEQALNLIEIWPNADITIVTDYLMYSVQALKKPDLEVAKAYYARGRMWCARLNRKESDERGWGGSGAIAVQFLYLGLLVFWATAFYGSRLGVLPSTLSLLPTAADFVRATIFSTEAIGLPFYTVVWGFLGGIAWCLYTATYWMGKGLFNNNYFGWYLALPFIGALLGGATSTIILAGITAIAIPSINAQVHLAELPFTVVATLCLVSFVAGYSARYIWKLLDRTIRKIFKDESEVQGVQSSVVQSLAKSNLEKSL